MIPRIVGRPTPTSFNDAFNFIYTFYIVYSDRISEYLIGKDVERNGRGLI